MICLDTGQQPLDITYLLVGCPPQNYLSTNQSIDGVCYVDKGNTWDLLLKPNEMVTGLHSFICKLPESMESDFLYSYAIAGKLNITCNDAH